MAMTMSPRRRFEAGSTCDAGWTRGAPRGDERSGEPMVLSLSPHDRERRHSSTADVATPCVLICVQGIRFSNLYATA
eukprot:2169181-Pyramimonas_sp.AAC.1